MRKARSVFALAHLLGVLIALFLLLWAGTAPAEEGTDAAPGSAAGLDSVAMTPAILPPTIVSLEDTPNDGGTGVDLTWSVSPSESLSPGSVIEYSILRSDSPDGEFENVGTVAAGKTTHTDGGLEPDKPYWYRVAAVGLEGEAESGTSGPGYGRMQWFNHDLESVLALTVLVCTLVVISIIVAKRKAGATYLRRLPVFDAIDEAIGRATEMGKKVLYIMGQLDVDEPQTVASMNVLARVADRAATYGTTLDIPCVWPMAMSMARETVKESYLRAGKPDDYSEDDIYYMTTDQFGYVAGVDGIMMRDRPAANFYLGAFYAESLIFAETGYTTGAIQIAGTAEVDQLPFFVVACDYTLIGEELYAAGASLSGDPVQIGSIRGQDIAKAVFIVIIIVGVVLKLLGIDAFEQWLAIG
jgi:hypothetical protein